MTLSIVIMAHRRRRHLVPDLRDQLDHPEVVWDRDNNRWETGRRALLSYDSEATHHMVVQDDAILPRDLPIGVKRALTYVPDDALLNLYIGNTHKFWKKLRRRPGQLSDVSWLIMRQVHWGVGLILPTAHIAALVERCDEMAEVDNYDRRISRACELLGLDVWYPWPSLIDHRMDTPSLVKGRSTTNRHAVRFIGADESAATADLDRRVLDLRSAGSFEIGRFGV